jgi:hypothetical protein
MFGNVDIGGFLYKLDQSLLSLIFWKIYMHYVMKRSEYKQALFFCLAWSSRAESLLACPLQSKESLGRPSWRVSYRLIPVGLNHRSSISFSEKRQGWRWAKYSYPVLDSLEACLVDRMDFGNFACVARLSHAKWKQPKKSCSVRSLCRRYALEAVITVILYLQSL